MAPVLAILIFLLIVVTQGFSVWRKTSLMPKVMEAEYRKLPSRIWVFWTVAVEALRIVGDKLCSK